MGSKTLKIGGEHFVNRELSWLEFNYRVLEEALDKSNPLLERLKFFCIFASNLDEFFEVRVAGVKQQMESDVVERSVDGLTATETFRAITRRVRELVDLHQDCWRNELVPSLARNHIHFLRVKELSPDDYTWIRNYYHDKVRPVLTPLGIDPSHPFPQLLNKSLNIMVELETTHDSKRKKRRNAVVQVPSVLPRLIPIPRLDVRLDYVFLGDLISHFLEDLFPGTTILGNWKFRLTRNSELYLDEEDSENLLKAVEKQLHRRRRGAAVRLEVETSCPELIQDELLKIHNLEREDLYIIDGPLNVPRLMSIYSGDHSPELREQPFMIPVARALRIQPDLFKAIRKQDILLHHPYESFDSVVDFLQQAAEDPKVLAVKQTLYRTGGDQRIIGALMKAVANGKQVTAVVELKARFDEANNIEWSRRLEQAGVHVVYGLVGFKIHCKMCLVVRHDDDGIRRYLHMSTGNYNASTAKIYTDIGLLTCDPIFGEDATNLFNLLTGVCQFQGMQKLLVAPFDLHRRMMELIEREIEHVRKGLPGKITAKMNSLVDSQIIKALYRASQAGVQIDLIVRGVCCLRPGIPGISENITVRSIVDRYLEHSRIFCFENGCQPEVYVGSADWMPRNFFRRIETIFPILDGNIRERIQSELLAITLQDNVKARIMQPDGTYMKPRPTKGRIKHRSQVEFMEMAKMQKNFKSQGIHKKGHPKVELRPPPPETKI